MLVGYAVAGVFHQQQLCKTFRKKISISHYSFIADAYFLKGPVGEKHQPWRKIEISNSLPDASLVFNLKLPFKRQGDTSDKRRVD